MSFGRWLLVHSFSIFILVLFMFGYIYRSELQLEVAFSQLLKPDSEIVSALPSSTAKPQQEEVKQATADIEVKEQSEVEQSRVSDEPVNSALVSVPTVSTTASDQEELDMSAGGSNRLFLARQAYWDKNYSDAIYLYRQLIEQNSNNPDYLGELGNIYYSLNDNNNASRLYYQAALLFINQNKPDRARSLVAPIIAMNRELGEKLRYRLQ